MAIHKKVALGVMVLGLAALGAVVVRGRGGLDYPRVLAESPMNALLVESREPPPFDAVDAQDRPIALRDKKGQWVLLNLWFSDCAPCKDEMPSLDVLAQRLGPKGLNVVALSVDPTWKKVQEFHASMPEFKTRAPAYQQWLDHKRMSPPRFGTFKFPETFLVDPQGKLRARFVGPRDWSSPESLALFASLVK